MNASPVSPGAARETSAGHSRCGAYRIVEVAASPLAWRQALRHRRQLSPHKRAEVRDWAAAHDVELVFLPTYSSWLNWIESEFAAMRYFELNRTDHRSPTSRTPPSAPTSAGAASTPNSNETSPSTPRSGDRITYRRLLDEALEQRAPQRNRIEPWSDCYCRNLPLTAK